MKKNIAIILAVVLLVIMGCASNNLKIEDTEWTMSTIQDSTASDVIMCSPQNAKSFPDAKHEIVKAEFDKGYFKLTSDSVSHKGTYSISLNSKPGINLYELHFEDNSIATASLNTTKYHDGSKKPTLIISNDKYTAYFYPSEV